MYIEYITKAKNVAQPLSSVADAIRDNFHASLKAQQRRRRAEKKKKPLHHFTYIYLLTQIPILYYVVNAGKADKGP